MELVYVLLSLAGAVIVVYLIAKFITYINDDTSPRDRIINKVVEEFIEDHELTEDVSEEMKKNYRIKIESKAGLLRSALEWVNYYNGAASSKGQSKRLASVKQDHMEYVKQFLDLIGLDYENEGVDYITIILSPEDVIEDVSDDEDLKVGVTEFDKKIEKCNSDIARLSESQLIDRSSSESFNRTGKFIADLQKDNREIKRLIEKISNR
ncbi:hypothetical protein ACI2JA_03740 [Alkalihalobacillus sp. NPDC078783]